MKQRSQAVSESLHNLNEHVEAIREILFDLRDLGIPVTDLESAVEAVNRFRLNVGLGEEISPPVRLAEPKPGPVNSLGWAPIPCTNGSLIREDPPCIACGAPESVCECDAPHQGDSTSEAPDEATEPVQATGRVLEYGAYDDLKGRMECHGVPAEMFPSPDPDQREPDYRCPMCNRFCLGPHPDDLAAEFAERKAGWDATP